MRQKKIHTKTEITTTQLVELAGLGERRLRQLAAEGRLPNPKRGKWEYPAAVSRLIAHFKELSENTPYTQAKTEREQARARIAKTQADLAEKKVVLLETVRRDIFVCVIAAKNKFQFADSQISAEMQMKFALSPEAAAGLREIIQRHRRAALMELHKGMYGDTFCPHCNTQVKTHNESK